MNRKCLQETYAQFNSYVNYLKIKNKYYYKLTSNWDNYLPQ